jgi:hypothetical protein
MGIAKEIVSIFFVAIVLYLILINGKQTTAIITALGSQITNATATLQGRDSTGINQV